jgi:4-amino-4-deoxy-L-arabinose transferase-like glycosyltransferase
MESQKNTTNKHLLFLVIFSAVCFLPFLGNAHLFDWDEINFAEIAREMLVSNDYFHPKMNFELFTEKPPFFFWLQAICMNIFGINEFSSRLPNAILGIIILPLLYYTGSRLKNNRFGLIWAIAYGCTILPHLYFKSGIIDPWFNFFIVVGLFGLIKARENKLNNGASYKWLLIAGVSTGLSILTKGPASLIILGLTGLVYFTSTRFKNFFSFKQIILFILITIISTGTWLTIDYVQNGDQFIKEFTIRQWELLTTKDAGHGGFFFYHFIVLFFGCFPISAFFIDGLIKKDERENVGLHDFRKWMVTLFWVVLILFSVVQTKIVHYSSLCYYPMSFIAALSIYNIQNQKSAFNLRTKILLIISSIPFVIAPFALVFFGKNKALLKPLLSKDPFAVENIQANVTWTGLEMLPGIVVLICTIACFYYFKKQKNKHAFIALFIGSVVFIQGGLYFFINRI